MKAVQFSEYGDAGVLRLVDAPEPHAGHGQIRIRVRAAGVNPVDWKRRKGLLATAINETFPVTTGSDVAGTVDEVGAGVTNVAIGDNVFGMSLSGAVAEYAVLEMYARKPATMSFVDAAGLTMAAETAQRGLRHLKGGPGDTLLVNGAAGGVGQAVVQLARAAGMTVIGTASEPSHQRLRELGALPTTVRASSSAFER